jgi:hypothetical protein
MTIALELGKTLAELEEMTLREERLWLARLSKDSHA